MRFNADGSYASSLQRLRTQHSEEQEKVEKMAHEMWDFFNSIGLGGKDNPFPRIVLEREWPEDRGRSQGWASTIRVGYTNFNPSTLLHELLHQRGYDHGWFFHGRRYMSHSNLDEASPYILSKFNEWKGYIP